MISTLRALHDPDVIQCFNVVLPLPGQGRSDPDADSCHPDDTEVESNLALFFRFTVELSSSRVWSQMQFAILIPQLLAIVWHESQEVRYEGLQQAKRIWQAILDAEAIVHDRPTAPQLPVPVKKCLQKCLTDLAWNRLQIARESYSVCRAADWSPGDSELRLFSHRLFARPCSTKSFLEDVFAHLSDLAKRHSKGMTMQRCLACNVVS